MIPSSDPQTKRKPAGSRGDWGRVLDICARVVDRAGRDVPADRALKELLRKREDVSPEVGRKASRSLFSYYRWYGWLKDESSLEQAIAKAKDLDARFKADPASITDLERRSVPNWVAGQLKVTEEWLRSLQSEPRLWLRARYGKRDSVEKALSDCVKVGEKGALEYRGERDLFRATPFREGDFEIQDISSQWVALLCDPKAGETWWDACAGEGGKTLHLSDLMKNKGLIWASDRSQWRLRSLKKRAGRAKMFNYRIERWNGSTVYPTKTRFDGVLLDAPCSGVGTWHRNPHARWTTTPRDVEELAAIQRRLLANAAQPVKPGGKLIYSVCTLTNAETKGVVEAFQEKHPEFEPLDMKHPVTGEQTSKIWLWPQDLGGSGMFIAGWRCR